MPRCHSKVLLEWIDKVPGVVYGVTSAAAGADLLFAETCLELHLPIRVFLPFPRSNFATILKNLYGPAPSPFSRGPFP